jgi:hypothetical protein
MIPHSIFSKCPFNFVRHELLKVKISLCIFSTVRQSAYSENTEKYLNLHGEFGVYTRNTMKNTTKLGLFAEQKMSLNARKVFKFIWRMCRKYFSAYKENAKIILPYSRKTPRDTKLGLS